MLTSNYEKNITTISSNNFTKKTITISIPIPVPIFNNNDNLNDTDDTNDTDNTNNIDEYSLNYNNFNPSKMSPPDLWKNRLKQRIENHQVFSILKA